MNPQWAKEWRPLRLPACIAAGAALLPLGARCGVTLVSHDLLVFLLMVAQGVFVLSIPLLAASSYGAEFHHRTFGLLLAQPAERRRIWLEKLLVLSAVVGALGCLWLAQFGLLHWLARATGSPMWPGLDFRYPFEFSAGELLTPVLVVLAVVLSGAFWTLGARSTIGGLVFTLAGSFLPLALVVLLFQAVHWLRGPGISPQTIENLDAWIEPCFRLVLPVYSGLFLWLGWRKFARMELKDAPSASAAFEGAASGRTGLRLGHWLRCRPVGATLNLVRKEVRLQRPLLMVAGAFVVCWLPAVLLCRLLPDRGYENILWGMACIYCPLTLLLAGALSLGEEANLGVSDWQLTLPVSARRQWAVKLGVGWVVALSFGVALPLFLAWATLPRAWFKLDSLDADFVVSFSSFFCTAFLLSFWAATLLRNTIHAVLATVVSTVVMACCLPAAAWLGEHAGGLQSTLLGWCFALFHLGPEPFHHSRLLLWAPIAVVGAAVASVALVQSFRRFRCSQASRLVLVTYPLILLAVAFLGVVWCTDFFTSLAQQTQILLGGG